jgi:hypothetical protein
LKKLSILLALLMVAGVASANTIIIPVFNDGGSLEGEAGSGLRTYIRVKNMDDATIVCAVEYIDLAGQDGTPVDNTFVLAPLSVVGFRPVASDSGGEGPSGMAVPNAEAVGTLGNPGAGGATISSANQIVGAIYEENYRVGGSGGSGIAPAQGL